jgi:hypothetical protein
MTTVACFFCGRTFRSKNALYAHLQFCVARKKARDMWVRYPVATPKFQGCIGVISRSPKTLKHIDAMHTKLERGEVCPEAFAGYVQALADVGLVETMTEAARPPEAPLPAESVVEAIG